MKSGWKTTEFWIALAVALSGILNFSIDLVPAEWGIVAAAISSAFYALSRGLAKSGGDDATLRLELMTQLVEKAAKSAAVAEIAAKVANLPREEQKPSQN